MFLIISAKCQVPIRNFRALEVHARTNHVGTSKWNYNFASLGDKTYYGLDDFTLEIYDTDDKSTEIFSLRQFRDIIVKSVKKGLGVHDKFIGIKINYCTTFSATEDSGYSKDILSFDFKVIPLSLYSRLLSLKLLGAEIDFTEGILKNPSIFCKQGVLNIPEGIEVCNINSVSDELKFNINEVICPSTMLKILNYTENGHIYIKMDNLKIISVHNLDFIRFVYTEDFHPSIVCRQDCDISKEFIGYLMKYYCKNQSLFLNQFYILMPSYFICFSEDIRNMRTIKYNGEPDIDKLRYLCMNQ